MHGCLHQLHLGVCLGMGMDNQLRLNAYVCNVPMDCLKIFYLRAKSHREWEWQSARAQRRFAPTPELETKEDFVARNGVSSCWFWSMKRRFTAETLQISKVSESLLAA